MATRMLNLSAKETAAATCAGVSAATAIGGTSPCSQLPVHGEKHAWPLEFSSQLGSCIAPGCHDLQDALVQFPKIPTHAAESRPSV